MNAIIRGREAARGIVLIACLPEERSQTERELISCRSERRGRKWERKEGCERDFHAVAESFHEGKIWVSR